MGDTIRSESLRTSHGAQNPFRTDSDAMHGVKGSAEIQDPNRCASVIPLKRMCRVSCYSTRVIQQLLFFRGKKILPPLRLFRIPTLGPIGKQSTQDGIPLRTNQTVQLLDVHCRNAARLTMVRSVCAALPKTQQLDHSAPQAKNRFRVPKGRASPRHSPSPLVMNLRSQQVQDTALFVHDRGETHSETIWTS